MLSDEVMLIDSLNLDVAGLTEREYLMWLAKRSQIKEECYIHSLLCILSVIFIVWRHI